MPVAVFLVDSTMQQFSSADGAERRGPKFLITRRRDGAEPPEVVHTFDTNRVVVAKIYDGSVLTGIIAGVGVFLIPVSDRRGASRPLTPDRRCPVCQLPLVYIREATRETSRTPGKLHTGPERPGFALYRCMADGVWRVYGDGRIERDEGG
jgi:hypothetical protein